MEAILIGGWGAAPEVMQAAAMLLPTGARCHYVPPVSGCVAGAGDSDFVVGWSFGAWMIMAAAAGGMAFRSQVLLLAPFVGFCSESGLGGRCSRAQVLWLHRWLKRDPYAALSDFYLRAELGPSPAALPYSREGLLEGLERMSEDASAELRAFAARGLPRGWRAVIGARDRLLDGAGVCRSLPGCELVPDAGHDLESLVAAMKGRANAV